MKVSGQSTTRSPEPTALSLRRRSHHRLNVRLATRGISRSGAMPPSRFAAHAKGRIAESALTSRAVRVRDTARSHSGSLPIA